MSLICSPAAVILRVMLPRQAVAAVIGRQPANPPWCEISSLRSSRATEAPGPAARTEGAHLCSAVGFRPPYWRERICASLVVAVAIPRLPSRVPARDTLTHAGDLRRTGIFGRGGERAVGRTHAPNSLSGYGEPLRPGHPLSRTSRRGNCSDPRLSAEPLSVTPRKS